MTDTPTATDAERRLLAAQRSALLRNATVLHFTPSITPNRSIARIDSRRLELEDASDVDEPTDEPDTLPWLELTDRKDGKGWHVLAPTTSTANPRVIAAATQGYSNPIDVRRSISLTLAAALRFPGSTATLAAYLLELDPTDTLASGLRAALDEEPRR